MIQLLSKINKVLINNFKILWLNLLERMFWMKVIIPGYSDIDLKRIHTEDDDNSVKNPKWD